ncbi:phage tail protein [Acetobacter persici]|uniref:phage tail protein n=1 Tax=Acetobacter persici TaxID=1076596 RepID=UPI0039E7D65B
MTGQTQVEQLDVIVTTRDETADGAASALRNLEAVEARGVSLTDVLSGMGDASGAATKTMAEGAAGAVTSFDDLGTRAAARVSKLTKELTHLSGMQETLRTQSQKALSEGVDASAATQGLEKVDAEIGRVAGELEEVQARLRAAAVSEDAWNGALGERNAILNGLRAALDGQTEAQTKSNAATAAGIAQTQDQASALSGVSEHLHGMEEAADAVVPALHDVSDAAEKGIQDVTRMAQAGEKAMEGISTPDLSLSASSTVTVETPDMGDVSRQTDKISEGLDSLRTEAGAVSSALDGMETSAGAATRTLREGAAGAVEAFDTLGTRAATRVASLTAELTRLSSLQENLRDQAQKAMAGGLDTSTLTQDLAQIDAQIQRTSADLMEQQSRVRQLKAAQDALNASEASAPGVVGGSSASVSAPSVSSTGAQAQAMQADLAAIKNAAGLTAGEMADLERAEASAFTGLQAGADRSAASMLRTARSSSQLARTLLQLASAESRLDDLRAQADAVPESQMDSSVKNAILQDAQQRVTVLQKQRDTLLETAQANDTLTEAENKGGSLVKLESYQVGQLADEVHKFFDQIMAGGSAMQAAFYQVPNMVQVMGGFGAAVQRVGSFIMGPAGLVAAGAAGGLALFEMGKYAESESEKLAKLSQQLRATRTDAVAMASTITSASKDLGSQPGWTDETARTAATSIGSTYNFNGTSADIQSIAGMARDIGAVFGSLEDGLKAVKTAMEDPAAEIEALYKQHLPGVDQALVEQVKNLQAAGRQGDAYALVMDKLTAATKGAYEDSLTPFQRAMENLRKAADPATDKIKDLSLAIGQYLVEGVTDLLNLTQGKYAQGDFKYAAGTTPVSASGDVSGTSLTVNKDHPQMVGLMQINTDYKSKYDPTTLDGNIDEGITRFQNFLKQTGNVRSALSLYGGATPGSANADAYVSKLGQQVVSQLPPVISGRIDAEVEKLGASPGIANIMKMIAMAESSGKQWQDQTYSNVAPKSEGAANDNAKSAAVIDDQRSLTGGAANDAGGYSSSSWSQSRTEIESYIQSEQKLQQTQVHGSEAWKETSERITTARIALANTLSPQEQITQGLKDQDAGLNSQTGYWRSMAEVVAQFGTEARGTGVDQKALSAALQERQRQLAAAYDDGTVAVQRQARAQQAIASVAGASAQEIQHATNYQQAYNEALENFDPHSQQFADAVNKRVTALNSLSDAQQRAQQLQQNAGLQDNLSMVQAETDSLGMNAQARQVMLARMQAEIQMHRQYGAVLPQEAQDYVELTTQIAQASAEYEHQQQVLQDVTGSISGMADELSSDITQGFVQGTSSGMSFKNMLKGVETQIASLVVKFALINPMLNAIDGQSRTTLSDISGILSGSGSQTSTAATASSGVSEADIAKAFSGTGMSVGETQKTESLAGLESFGGGTYGSGVNGSSVPQSAAGGFGGISQMFGGTGGLMSSSGMQAAGTFGGAASLAGGAIGGLTTGYAVGKMASNLTGGGQGGKIGAAIGSGIGTVAGTVFGGPIGGMIGGTVLGAIGGIIGGLFNKPHWSYDAVSASGGQLVAGANRSKHADDDVTSGLNTDLASVNAAYMDAGISVVDGDYGQVGHYHKGKKHSTTSLQDLLPDVKLHSDDANTNLALQQLMPKSFDSVDSYTQAIASIKQLAETLDSLHVSVSKFDDQTHVTVDHITGYTGDLGKVLSGFDGKTVSTSALQSMISSFKSLLDITDAGSQSIVSQVADLREQYKQAADQAKAYGLDYQVILDKGDAIAARTIQRENLSLSQADASVNARYLAAKGDQEDADLVNFDVSAAQQIQQMQDNWESYLGDTYASNQDYASQMADLEKTLGAERIAIQKTYADKAAEAAQEAADKQAEAAKEAADKAAQAAEEAAEKQQQIQDQATQSLASTFSSLTDYAKGLSTSDASPLSVADKYAAANDNLHADYQAALGGNSTALGAIQSDMQTFLSLSKSLNGGGIGYTTDYQQIVTMLQALGNIGTGDLTADAMRKITEDQTTTLAGNQQLLLAAVRQLLSEIRFQNSKAAA